MLCTENVGRTNGGKFITWKVNVVCRTFLKKKKDMQKW